MCVCVCVMCVCVMCVCCYCGMKLQHEPTVLRSNVVPAIG